MVFCWYSDLILHTQRHPAHSGASRLTHPYKYIFRTTATCSQQLSLLHWMNNSLIPKNIFHNIFFCSKTIHLQKSYLLIRYYKTRFFLWNTNNTDENGVNNKQNTQPHKTVRERWHWKRLISIKIRDTLKQPLFLWKKSEPHFFW